MKIFSQHRIVQNTKSMICTCVITKYALLTECQPIQFWIISRHGTRYTDVDGINEMWSLTDVRHQIVSNHKHGRKYHYNILFREQIHNIKPCDVRNYELSNPQTFANEVPVSWKLLSFPETFILSLFIRTHNTLYATCPSQLVFSTFFRPEAIFTLSYWLLCWKVINEKNLLNCHCSVLRALLNLACCFKKVYILLSNSLQ
jgi:hypothetical protein